jgi:protein-S-isoprenylcysteine O-methyltransferase Ste14
MDAIPGGFWPACLIGTAAIILFSWRISIRAKRYHGIARFFAFESILLLVLLNIRVWFRDPFATLQILSWVFLTASLFLALHSILLYHAAGAHSGQFENSTRLVVRGAYRYIRHPMYASLALLGLGIFFKRVTALTTALVAVDLLAVYLTARIEEGEMRTRFGSEYSEYMRKTRMFLPHLFSLLAVLVRSSSWIS